MESRFGWRTRLGRLPVWWLVLASAGAPCLASASAKVTGQVVLGDGSPATDARVVILELDRSVFVDDDGRFRFDDVPRGTYHVQAKSRLYGSLVVEVDVGVATTPLTLELLVSAHAEKVVVTATRSGRGSAEVVQPVNVLDEATLNEKMQPTLGETLASEPGVSSSFFGVGSSRPVIRGQSGGRVRVLEGGLGVGDASTTSPDHAVATDTMGAEQIEILRGPSTLLYGSAAVGGVVNIVDRRIPEFAPQRRFGGELNLRLASAADEASGSLGLQGGGGHFAWRLDALKRDTGDYDIPGPSVLGDPSSPAGRLPNSALESEGATLGGSWVGRGGFAGVSTKLFRSTYGIPANLEDPGEPPGVEIDLEQRRHDVRGGFDLPSGGLTGVRFGLGITDYEHAEIEDGMVGTTFFNDHEEARLELNHGRTGRRRGTFGGQYGRREFDVLGDEAFLPRSRTEQIALFALEEIGHGEVRYEVGARVERTELTTTATPAADPLCSDPRDREFDTLSGSFGMAWVPNDTFALGASLTRAQRAPAAEELYACGEHIATASFEVGDPDLEEETAVGVDVSLRRREGRVTGELNLFHHRYDDYVFELDAGGGVFVFTQEDAAFRGAEIEALVELYHANEHDLDLRVFGDVVRGELRDSDTPLPRIPARRVGLGIQYGGRLWRAGAEVVGVADQDRTAPSETPTEGYTLVNASVGIRVVGAGGVHDLLLRATNLTDEEARPHTSRLKAQVPLPGADVSLIYRMVF